MITESERPTFSQIYMLLASALAKRSTCARLQVGCVITTIDYRQVLAIGYNGGASGLENDCDSSTPGACGHLHAEENAIINCSAPRQLEKRVFLTHTPCLMCAKRLINLGGVVGVTFGTEYRDLAGVDLLQRAGIWTLHRAVSATFEPNQG